MALKHVVLFVVGESPGHGYAVYRRVVEILPDLRGCDSSRVYSILSALERDGLVVSRPERVAARPGRMRKRYVRTEAGAEVWRRWMDGPRPSRPLLRRSLLVRRALSGLFEVPASGLRRALEESIQRRDRRLVAPAQEDRVARWHRMREVAHLEAEQRILREWVSEETGPVDAEIRSSGRRSSGSRSLPARSSASR